MSNAQVPAGPTDATVAPRRHGRGHAPLVVVGGGPAALTAAEVAARAGVPVQLFLPERGVGGGFQPIRQGEQVLQLGARTIELAERGPMTAGLPSLETYRPGPTGFVPWWPLATTYLLELLEGDVRALPTPRLFVDGDWVDDAYLTVDLEPLARRTPAPLAARIAAEAAHAEQRAGHPAGVLRDEAALWSMTLGEATRRNAGPTFTEWLIEPAAAKLLDGGADAVVAAARRKLWLPLFWPRTVREAFSGVDASFRPDRRFHVDADGGTGRVVDALLRRLDAHPGVRIERYRRLRRVEGDRLVFEVSGPGGASAAPVAATVELQRPAVLGVGTEELIGAIGVDGGGNGGVEGGADGNGAVEPLPRLELGVVWLTLARPTAVVPAMGFVTDADVEAFRVSTNGAGSGCDGPVVTVEFGHGVAGPNLRRVAAETMVRLGLCERPEDVEVIDTWRGPAVPAPTFEAVERHRRAVERVAAAELGHHVVGGAAAFGADSLNEQLVAGHAAALVATDAVALVAA